MPFQAETEEDPEPLPINSIGVVKGLDFTYFEKIHSMDMDSFLN